MSKSTARSYNNQKVIIRFGWNTQIQLTIFEMKFEFMMELPEGPERLSQIEVLKIYKEM